MKIICVIEIRLHVFINVWFSNNQMLKYNISRALFIRPARKIQIPIAINHYITFIIEGV